ncbi:MAG: NgoFVII family restriction endonuclease [Deltaproteobacteria bacterium]|nr:NgoFVII family restriction endonuclease [Deltaproteobacteria bacterium]
MIASDLFDEILVKPAKNGGNKLYIVSGYATSAMASHHLNFLKEKEYNVEINLTVGMSALDGLTASNHRGFQQLAERDFEEAFSCGYVVRMPAVHAKTYAWFKNDEPLFGFAGSANYTQTAFGKKQREAMVECSALACFEYYKRLQKDTIFCTHIDAENLVQIYNDRTYARLQRERKISEDVDIEKSAIEGLSHISINFLDRSGKLPERSGLNWGERPEYGRNPNQAYIRVPSSVYNTDFFPSIGTHFTVLTDDDIPLICTRAQANGKAIHTPLDNSLIGLYFRTRLGLPSGALITKEDLLRYGRTTVDFYKIDDETYYMDFSV